MSQYNTKYATMNDSSVPLRAAQIALDFYRDAPKRTLVGKTAQKAECAKAVLSEVPLDTLLAATAVRLQHDPRIIFFRYEVFKTYATEETSPAINRYVANLVVDAIAQQGSCEFHVDLASFTVSAAERYRGLAAAYVAHCVSLNVEMSTMTTRMVVYNAPTFVSTVSSIAQQFVPPGLLGRIEYYSRAESAPMIAAMVAAESG